MGVLGGHLQVVASAGVSPAFATQPTAPTADLVGPLRDGQPGRRGHRHTHADSPGRPGSSDSPGRTSPRGRRRHSSPMTSRPPTRAASTGSSPRTPMAGSPATGLAPACVPRRGSWCSPPTSRPPPATTSTQGDADGTPGTGRAVAAAHRRGLARRPVRPARPCGWATSTPALSGTTFLARLTNPVGSVTSASGHRDRRRTRHGAPRDHVRHRRLGREDVLPQLHQRTDRARADHHDRGRHGEHRRHLAFPVVDGEWRPSRHQHREPRRLRPVHRARQRHRAALDLTITEPRVVIGTDAATLVADVTSRGLSSGQTATYDDVVLADLDTDGRVQAVDDTLSLSSVPATLTAAGAPAFADFYPAATALDPLSGSVRLGDVVEEPGTPEEPVTTTTTVLVADATPYGRGAAVRVAVSAEGRQPVNGTAHLSAAGRTWTAGRRRSGIERDTAGIVPGSYAVQATFLGAAGSRPPRGATACGSRRRPRACEPRCPRRRYDAPREPASPSSRPSRQQPPRHREDRRPRRAEGGPARDARSQRIRYDTGAAPPPGARKPPTHGHDQGRSAAAIRGEQAGGAPGALTPRTVAGPCRSRVGTARPAFPPSPRRTAAR